MNSTSSHSSSHCRKGSRLYATHDQWHVTSAVSSGGVVQERYAYNAFGGSIVLSPAFIRRTESTFDWETRFSSYIWDAESDLYAVRFRFLHPCLGRWISRDFIDNGKEGGLYDFVQNASPNASDTLGLQANTPGGNPYPCLEDELKSEPFASLIKQITKNGCTVDVKCQCYAGNVDSMTTAPDSKKMIKVKISTFSGTNPSPSSLLHELIHARDYCEGWLKNDCRSHICSELKAYKAQYMQFNAILIDNLPPDLLKGLLCDNALNSAESLCKSERNPKQKCLDIYAECVPPGQNVF